MKRTTSRLNPVRIQNQINALNASRATYAQFQAECNAEADAAKTTVAYERASTRANEMERIQLRLDAERKGLEAKLAALQPMQAVA